MGPDDSGKSVVPLPVVVPSPPVLELPSLALALDDADADADMLPDAVGSLVCASVSPAVMVLEAELDPEPVSLPDPSSPHPTSAIPRSTLASTGAGADA